MTQTDNPMLDDLARLLTGAAGAAHGVRREMETLIRNQVQRLINDMDLVSRETVDALAEMAANAREENQTLRRRMEAMERQIAELRKQIDASKKHPN